MTPTRYCQPSPCPNGHPIHAVRRIRWPFAGTSRWRCDRCHEEWERPSRDYPPSLAERFPAIFRELRALNAEGSAACRIRRALRFWAAFNEGPA